LEVVGGEILRNIFQENHQKLFEGLEIIKKVGDIIKEESSSK